jgi:hypothetical protein
MRHFNWLAGSVVVASLVAGCQSDKGETMSGEPVKKLGVAEPAPLKPEAPKVEDKSAKEAAAIASAEYFETEDQKHPTRIYVMASKKTADAVAASQHPTLMITKIGFGPKGETVIFEDSEGGGVAKKLISEFKVKHGLN